MTAVPPLVLVFGKRECVSWLESSTGVPPLRGVVSIGDPDCPPPQELDSLACPVLRLEFLDRYDTGALEGKVGPSSVHVIELGRFAEILQPRLGVAVVHCDAGLSRGPSVGWLLACLLTGPGDEVRHLQAILAQRPGAGINPWLITLAQRRFRQFDFVTATARQANNGLRR